MRPTMTVDEFKQVVSQARVASQAIDLLRRAVISVVSDAARPSYLHVLMSLAHTFNEDRHDLGAAIALWKEIHAWSMPGEARNRVVATMRKVARDRGNTDLPPKYRDTASSVRIYEAIYGLDLSREEKKSVIRTMMSIANLLTQVSRPDTMDVDSAILLWRAVHGLHASADDDLQVVRTMMDVANRLTDLRTPEGVIDLDAAIRIWKAVADLAEPGDDRERVVRTMMALAGFLTDIDAPSRARDPAGAVRVWLAVHDLATDDEERLHIVKTMMDVANKLTDTTGAGAEMDADGAMIIWRGIAAMSLLPADREQVVLTAMVVAGLRVGDVAVHEPEAPHLLDALKLWAMAFDLSATEAGCLRTIKTILAILGRSAAASALAAKLLDGHVDDFPDRVFRLPVRAGLLYYACDYAGVVALARAERDPLWAVAALAADALRKQSRLDEAIAACDGLLGKRRATRDLADADAQVSALCCRGYCMLEKGREDPAKLDEALADFEAAVRAAEKADLPIPPRAFTGAGYVLRLQGREAEAQAAFERALELDGDNAKAREATSGGRGKA
jgi:hypothetical protein